MWHSMPDSLRVAEPHTVYADMVYAVWMTRACAPVPVFVFLQLEVRSNEKVTAWVVEKLRSRLVKLINADMHLMKMAESHRTGVYLNE